MGNSGDWRDVVAGLDECFYCVAVDLPGHGSSLGFREGSYTMEGAANALIRTLDDLEIQRAALVGYSMGGRLALYFALHHPERCESLFLESASPGLKSERERAARRRSDEEKAKFLESGDFEEFLERWYRQPLFASLHDELVEDLIERRKANDPSELARSLRGTGAGSQPSLWEEMKTLRVPTLVIVGELDEKFTNTAREMANLSLLISPEVVPDAGHNVRLEAPEEYVRIIGEFLGGE